MNTSPLSAEPLVSNLTPRGSNPMEQVPAPNRTESDGSAKPKKGLSQPLRRAAHDLRGPMNTILLNLELLRESFAAGPSEEAGPRQERYVSVIGTEVQRLSGMLDALFGQLGILQEGTERFDLREAVGSLSTLLPPYARRKRVEIRFSLPDGPLEIEGNREIIQDALIGLLMFAVEAMPGGGELEVKLDPSNGAAILSIIGPILSERETGPDSNAMRHLALHHGGVLRILHEGRSRPAMELELPLVQSQS